MKKSINRKSAFTFLLTILSSINVFAQQTVTEVPMADRLREDGKIWVVVAVVAVVMAGLILYLISIDRKVSKLEKELRK